MNVKKIIIYNKVSFFSIFNMLYEISKKNTIKYMDISPNFKKSKIFNYFSNNGCFERIKWNQFSFAFHMDSHNEALSINEEVFSKYFSHMPLLKHISTFFNSEMIYLVYKKELVFNIQSFLEKKNTINALAKNGESIIFKPDLNYYLTSKIVKHNLESCINIPLHSRIFLFFCNICNKLYLMSVLSIFPIALIVLKTKKFSKKIANKKEYLIGFRVYNNDWAFLFKHRKIDFLIDGKKITKDNTVFCLETDISKDYFDQLKLRGYNIVDIKNNLKCISFDFLFKTVLSKAFPCSLKASIFSLLSPFYMIKTTIGIILNYMQWALFLENYDLKQYVVYTHFDKYQIVRNIMLNQSKTKSWYYIHSVHHFDLFEKINQNKPIRHVFYSYLFYDNIVSWGNICQKIFGRTQNYISNYYDVGCLWSEHVLMTVANEKNNPCRIANKSLKNIDSNSHKIVGLFDTSFGEGVILQLDDLKSFYEGILRILKKYPEIFIVFKQKKEWHEMVSQLPEIKSGDFKKIFDKLLNHQRFYSVGRFTDTVEIIAKSDLVISACFTSTTNETLGARKKAIFFDSESKFRNCYYDKFPKLVAHGYNELDKYVNFWLYEIDDDEFNNYLKNYVLEELDANLEGKGITKFRELLIA